MTMVDAAINFMCHNSGDRMALFMAEKGVECLTEHQEQVYPFWKHLNLSMDKLEDMDVSPKPDLNYTYLIVTLIL